MSVAMQTPPESPLVHRGTGPVATVYATMPAAGGRPTAVKVYPGRLERETAEVLFHEQRTLAGLRSVSSILLFDGVDELPDGRAAVRMELCTQSLAELVTVRGPLPVPEALAAAETVTRVLVDAHIAGIVHGGVAPANVLFRSAGQPVLADFGIDLRFQFPRQPEDAATCTAPEVLRGAEPTAPADLYGVGALLHFALTGTPPFSARTGEPGGELLLRALGEPAPPISGRDDLPPTLPATVSALLSKDPADRPSGPDLLDRLTELTALSPVPTTEDDDFAFDDFSGELPPTPAPYFEPAGTTPWSTATPDPSTTAFDDFGSGNPPPVPQAPLPQAPPAALPVAPAAPEAAPAPPAPPAAPVPPAAPPPPPPPTPPPPTPPPPTPPPPTPPPPPPPPTPPPPTPTPPQPPQPPQPPPAPTAPTASRRHRRAGGGRLPRNVLLGSGAGLVVVMVVLGVLASGAGSPDPEPTRAATTRAQPSGSATAEPSESPSSVSGSVRLEIGKVVDHGSSLAVSWRSSEPLTYAVIVAEQGKPAPAVRYRGKATKLTIPVESDLKYCVVVQGTDGTSTYESRPRSVRGATCEN